MDRVKALLSRLQPWRYPTLWVVWCVLFAEVLLRGNFLDAFVWAGHHLPLFLLTMLLPGGFMAALAALTGWPRISGVVMALVLFVPALVSGVKLRLLGVPLLLGDLNLAGEASEVTHLSQLFPLGLVVTAACLLVAGGLLLWFWRQPSERPQPRQRAITGGVAAGLALVVVLVPVGAVRWLGGEPAMASPAQAARSEGLLLSVVGQLKDLHPVGSKALAATLPVITPPAPPEPAAVKPNVIVLLSESLFDLTKLPGATYSQDPLPFIHSLQGQYPTGTMLSPTFGGSTANAEFEVLTGLSYQFLPPGGVVYNRFIDRPVDSLASILGRQGYTTSEITPWYQWFFNNNKVYRYMGFSHLVTLEYMKSLWKGGGVSDDEMANLIIQESEKGPGPHFVFANTAQNHYPFDRAKYDDFEVKVSGLSQSSTDILEAYAQGSLDADRMFHKLATHFEQTKQPTIILFFGDHLPVLGQNYQVYKESGFITGVNDPDFLNKIYRPVVAVWDNYLPKQPETISFGMNFAPSYLLKRAGLPGTPLLDYLSELNKKIPAIPEQQYWPSWEITEQDLETYRSVEQDVMFGDQKTYEGYKDKIIDANYLMGYGPIRIEQIDTEATANDVTLILHGQNLPPQGTVYLGETPLKTTWPGDTSLKAVVPKVQYKAGAEIQVRLIDSQKTVIQKSDPVGLPVIETP